MKTKLLITGFAFMAMTTLVSAQNQGAGQRQQNATGKNLAFVDANKNGICDNYENRTSNSTVSTGNYNYKGYGRGLKQGQRQGFGQQGIRQGRGNNGNFIDENKNGICDFRETSVKK